MKRTICMMMALVLMLTALTACGMKSGGKKDEPKNAPMESAAQVEGKTVSGVINKIDNYLVLLTDDGEYHVMDFGEGVTLDDFAEGDKVDVTYTGQLDAEGTNPVIVSIAKAE